MQKDGKYLCDNCGGETGSGVVDSLVVSDLEKDAHGEFTGMVVNHHFCRVNKCDRKVLRKAVLVAYTAGKEAERAAQEKAEKKGKRSG